MLEDFIHTLGCENLFAFLGVLVDVLPLSYKLQGNTFDFWLITTTTSMTNTFLGHGWVFGVLSDINLVTAFTYHLPLAQVIDVLQTLAGLPLGFCYNLSYFGILLEDVNDLIRKLSDPRSLVLTFL